MILGNKEENQLLAYERNIIVPENGLRTAFFLSGEGTTAEAVIKACQGGELTEIDPAVVIASKPDAGGICRW